MIIFGWGRTTVRQLGQGMATRCVNCHNPVVLQHVGIRTWFTLFFIPIFPYRSQRLFVCPVCMYAQEEHHVQKPDVASGGPSAAAPSSMAAVTDLDYYAKVDGPDRLDPPPPPPPPPQPPDVGPPR